MEQKKTCAASEHLNEEEFGFADEARAVVAFDGLHKLVNLDDTVSAVDHALVAVTQNGAGETVRLSVVIL